MNDYSKYPDFVARFYETIYSKIRTRTDHEYYMKKILGNKGPVLEIGVGTGRFFIDALNKGADIYGTDISKNMIEKLKEKLDKKYYNRVLVQDARNLNLDKKFDLIIAPFRMFAHLIEVKDQLMVLNNIYDYLNKDGIFIFDIYVPDLRLLLEGIENLTDFKGEYEKGKKVKRIVSMKADLMNQVSHVKMKFVWEENNKEITKEWEFPMRYFFRYELVHLINQSKLKLKNIFGDYFEHELNSNSKDFIVVCRKEQSEEIDSFGSKEQMLY